MLPGNARPRVAHVHPWVTPHGGGQAVAAWTLQALRDAFDVTLITWDPPDWDGVNRMFGTSLRPGDARVVRPWVRRVGVRPGRAHMLVTALLLRVLRALDARAPFDAILGTHDEMDFGRAGVQYVHYPHAYAPPAPGLLRGVQRLPSAVGAYRTACHWLSPTTGAGIRRNVTLVNSRFIAGVVSEVYGVPSVIVHPPVPGGFPEIPWEAREDGVACLGRLAPVKQWTEAVDVLDALQARGHRLRLHIIGTPQDAGYEARLRALAADRPWMALHESLPRDAMMALVARQRYGLHVQQGEHFGIAVAELVRAGCLTFVARPGGPEEIVGDDPALIFGSPAEAVERMARVLEDPRACTEARQRLEARRHVFTEERFMQEMRRAVEAAIEAGGHTA